MLSLFWLDIIFLRPSHYAISTYLIIMLRPIITNVASWQSIPIFHSKQMYYPAMENHKCQSLSEMLKFFTICEQFDLLVALTGEKAGDPQSHYDSSSRYLYRILSMVKMFESEPKKWFDEQISPTVEKTLLAWLKNVGTGY